MYIREIYIEAFGILKSQLLRPDTGLSCYVLGNGRGKTTLTYFIKAMLFGLDDTRRSLPDNERMRFIPWDRDRAGGHLTVECSGRLFRIERSFGRRAGDDTLTVYDVKTERKTDELGTVPGATLLGIDKDGFEKTLFISERLLRNDGANDLVSGRLSDGGEAVYAIDEYKRACSLLENARKEIKRRGGGELTRCKEELSSLEARASVLRHCDSEYPEVLSRLHDTEKRIDDVLKQGGDKQSRDTNVPRARGSRLRLALVLFAVLSFILAGIGYAMSYVTHAHTALGIGIILLLLWAIARPRRRIADTPYTKDADGMARRAIELERERSCLTFKRDELLAASDELSLLLDEIARLKARILSLEEEYRAIELTEELLGQAKDAAASKYLDGTRRAFDDYLKLLGVKGTLKLDSDFNILCQDTGGMRAYEAYSKGRRELYSFALRLAIIDSLFYDITPPIIIDDAFATYDDESLALAARLILKLSEGRQIIYLTPSHARARDFMKRN
ncbi:MAG: hypothetical protein IJY01_07905 [Clostridia bacterium]|nr:hypothetical protein [Clostridia bacterium]